MLGVGTAVSVGGKGVADGGEVAVGGDVGVEGKVAVGGGVAVGETGVSVKVGWGVNVNVGARVLVEVGTWVWVGVRDGTRVKVAVDLGIRVLVGGTGVQVIKGLVGVMYVIDVREGVIVSVNVGVGVGMYSEISTAVRAATVLMGLEMAESTISCAPMSEAPGVLGFARAAAETIQSRLNPNAPAPRTVRGPE